VQLQELSFFTVDIGAYGAKDIRRVAKLRDLSWIATSRASAFAQFLNIA
jgi:hypothetical protein